ncbi:MAG: hypothetical protein RXO76_08210 [Vulcanisaeta sp.]
MNSPARVNFTLRLIVLILAITSVIIIIANSIYAIPSLVTYSSIGRFGEVNYYASQPMPGVPPGLLVRVFLVNGSVFEPVRAFIDVYANAPSGIVHVSMGYSTTLIVPFSNANWQYVIGRWASLGIPFSDYETSMLIFVTYVEGNESWILPLLVPYNVGWAYAALGRVTPLTATLGATTPRYIVVNAFINVNELRPNEVVPAKLNSTVTDPQIFGTYYNYTIYNCSLSGPQPPQYPSAPTSLYMYQPTSDCVGINGSLPIAWVTWSNGVIQNDQGLLFNLNIEFVDTINWDAMATSYGDIGTSYSAPENWGLTLENAVQLGSLTQPGSVYWYYENATWGIVKYSVYECGNINYLVKYGYCPYYNVYVGTTLVSEVLYVPPYDAYSYAFDYGSGPISLFYYGAIPASEQYFGYPVLNASSVVDYAAFSNGNVYQCNGPVNIFPTGQGTFYNITLGGVEQAYGLSAAELGTALVEIVLGIGSIEAAIYGVPVWLSLLLSAGSLSATIAGLLVPPSTSTTITQTELDIGGVTTSTSLYISVIDATAAYGLPTFGFILNATSYYGSPTTYACNYGKVAQIG